MSRLTVGSLRVTPPAGGGSVGSLRGVPQLVRPPRIERAVARPPDPPPSKRGRGCCRKGCAGCPWAEAMRRRVVEPASPV